jgi:hypothetical protein
VLVARLGTPHVPSPVDGAAVPGCWSETGVPVVGAPDRLAGVDAASPPSAPAVGVGAGADDAEPGAAGAEDAGAVTAAQSSWVGRVKL